MSDSLKESGTILGEEPELKLGDGSRKAARRILDRSDGVSMDNLPLGRLRDLIQRLNPSIRGHVVTEYSNFERWLADPVAARVEWLLQEYVALGWISLLDAESLKSTNKQDAYGRLRAICLVKARLRQAGRIPATITITKDMISAGTNLCELLSEYGVRTENIRLRHVDSDRLTLSGNDRDDQSQQVNNHHGGYDGEELAMIKCGVLASQSTYVTNVKPNSTVADLSMPKYLVYAGDALTYVGPAGYPRSNGFSVFHFQEDAIMQRSLLAVINIRPTSVNYDLGSSIWK